MSNQPANLPAWWAGLILEELKRRGLKHIVISPGSRSSPLTVHAARDKYFQTHIAYDERAAAFFAVGLGRSSGFPAGLICTSGTAVANYLPAVIEASQDNVPLLVLSADRPRELWGTGANQTIVQDQIFGSYCRFAVTLPEPDPALGEIALTECGQAWEACIKTSYPGPVHLNIPLVEPLAPTGKGFKHNQPSIITWEASGEPFKITADVSQESELPKGFTSEADFKSRLTKALSSGPGLVIGGRIPMPVRTSILTEISTLQDEHENAFTFFGDVQSGWLGDCIDLDILANENILHQIKPQWILQLGAMGLSKHLPQFIKDCNCPIFSIHQGPMLHTTPNTKATRLQAGWPQIIEILKWLTGPLESVTQTKVSIQEQTRLKKINTRFEEHRRALAKIGQSGQSSVSEISAALTIADVWPKDWPLLAGNSMPIRTLSMAGAGGRLRFVNANRGASGIDGNIATACGIAAGSIKPVGVFIGDLTAFHDLNSLYLVAQSKTPMLVIIINNFGGGIFRHLPIANHPDVFQKFFTTPHTLTFKQAAQMFNLAYEIPKNGLDFHALLSQFIKNPKTMVIEIQISQKDNYSALEDFKKSVGSLLQGFKSKSS